jgi:hypothetical protein
MGEMIYNMGARGLGLANPTDVDSLLGIYTRKVEWFQQKGITQWDDIYLKRYMNKEILLGLIEVSEYFVLRDVRQIMAGCILQNTSPKWTDTVGNVKYIDYLVSAEIGAGKELIKNIITYCKEFEIDKLRLDCQDHNELLKQYYFKIGFDEIRKVKHKYFEGRYSCLLEYRIT